MRKSLLLLLVFQFCPTRHLSEAFVGQPCSNPRRQQRIISLLAHSAASNASQQQQPFISIQGANRVFCLSDLHTDHVVNQQWLRAHMMMMSSSHDWQPSDVLVIAGDISHDMKVLRESLQLLRQHNATVLFVVGNHEAWLRPPHDKKWDSLRKLQKVHRVCRQYGVIVDTPVLLEGPNPLWIVPLQSWYDGSLSFSEELCQGFEHWPWVDFLRTSWPQFPATDPTNARIPTGLVEHFLDSNIDKLALVSNATNVMTVSHFLPNVQTLPDWKDLESTEFQMQWLDHGAGEMSAKFAKVAGSRLIDQQIRTSLHQKQQQPPRTHLHVFGHSHRPKDFVFRGIRYIHNPLGKPRERELHMIDPNVDFQLVWRVMERGQVQASRRLLRYWEELGGGKEALWERLERVRPGRYSRSSSGAD